MPIISKGRCKYIENPEEVLESLRKKAYNRSYTFTRLYRIVRDYEFLLLAYRQSGVSNGASPSERIRSRHRGPDPGTRKLISGLSESLESQTYRPQPLIGGRLLKSDAHSRPAELRDAIVAEAVRLLLEAIFEPIFADSSHGFRRGRSSHTALLHVKRDFKQSRWLSCSSIKGRLSLIDRHKLVHILRRRIKDERFMALIWKLLKAGYTKVWSSSSTYSGTQQGTPLGELLANIYLNEFDAHMERYAHHPTGPGQNIAYVRYRDDYLIGVTGSKKHTKKTVQYANKFLDEQLKLLTHADGYVSAEPKQTADFVGYKVSVADPKLGVQLSMPTDGWKNRLLALGAIKIKKGDKGKEVWMPQHISRLIHRDDHSILSEYNAEVRGMREYYGMARNAAALSKFGSLMKYSMYKTLAAKYRLHMSDAARKYRVGKRFGVDTPEGCGKAFFYDEGFETRIDALTHDSLDRLPYLPGKGHSAHQAQREYPRTVRKPLN